MDDVQAEPVQVAQAAENGAAPEGVIARLRQRGEDLAKGRRLTMPLPGWDDLGDGRGLWARFLPVSRKTQQAFGWTPDDAKQEIDFIAPMIAQLCEEILIGTRDKRTPLAAEPGVDAPEGMPLRFDPYLGELLGTGGHDGTAVVKRMLAHAGDDIALFGVWGELLAWSASAVERGVESAAGE